MQNLTDTVKRNSTHTMTHALHMQPQSPDTLGSHHLLRKKDVSLGEATVVCTHCLCQIGYATPRNALATLRREYLGYTLECTWNIPGTHRDTRVLLVVVRRLEARPRHAVHPLAHHLVTGACSGLG